MKINRIYAISSFTLSMGLMLASSLWAAPGFFHEHFKVHVPEVKVHVPESHFKVETRNRSGAVHIEARNRSNAISPTAAENIQKSRSIKPGEIPPPPTPARPTTPTTLKEAQPITPKPKIPAKPLPIEIAKLKSDLFNRQLTDRENPTSAAR